MEHLNCCKCGNDTAIAYLNTCRLGHSSCSTCCKEKRCPECRFYARKFAYPDLVARQILEKRAPCPYAARGCPARVAKHEVDTHLGSCKFNGIWFSLCYDLGLGCDHKMCPLEIEDYVDHLLKEHGAKLHFESTSDTVGGLLENPSTKKFKYSDYLGIDPAIIRVKGEHVAGAKNGDLYFLVIGGCTDDYFHYICVHLGPFDTPVLKNYEFEVELKSHNRKIPSLRINPQIMDISHVGSLDQDHCSMFEVPVVNLRRNYVDSNNFIHQKLTVKPATNNPTVIVSTAQKLCCCDGVAHAVGENCTDERYQCDYEYQVEI